MEGERDTHQSQLAMAEQAWKAVCQAPLSACSQRAQKLDGAEAARASEVARLQRQLSALQAERDLTAQPATTTHHAESVELEARCAQLQRDAQGAAAAHSTTTAALQSQLDAMTAQSAALAARNAELEALIAQSARALGDEATAVSRLNAELSANAREAVAVPDAAELNSLRQQADELAATKARLDQQDSAVAGLEARIGELQQELAEAVEAGTRHQTTAAALQCENQALAADVAQHTSQRAEREAILAAAQAAQQSQGDKHSADLVRLQAALDDAASEIEALKQREQALANQLQDV